jgi:hypothetical protein
MKKRNDRMIDELRPEYDLRQLLKGAVRGQYAKQYHAGTIQLRKVGSAGESGRSKAKPRTRLPVS